jgi:very-short-patch-repair endonuclease
MPAHDVEHIDRVLARLAGRQDGVVARAQLVALGIGPEAIKHRIRAGRLIVLHRGVYAVGHTALTDRARARAGLLAAGPGAVLSHRTAAALWQLVPSMPRCIDVTVTTRARRPRPDLRIHQTRRPPAIRSRSGLRVTAPLRTLADLAASPDCDRLCSEALVLKLVTEPELEAAGLLTADVAPTRSEFERRFRALVRQAGLPQPLVSHRIGRYTADFVWPHALVIVETDGWRTHRHRAAFEHDRGRDAELAALGYIVVRFTWRQVRDQPMRVAAQLAQVLSRRSPPPRAAVAA